MIFASMKHLRSIIVFVVMGLMSSGLTTNVVGHCLLRGLRTESHGYGKLEDLNLGF